jgi:hypothetical protein
MHFEDLQGLTSLPVEHVRHRFRGEEVITVLPVRTAAGRQSLLVATPSKAAVVIGESPESEHWMTYWASWDTVRIVDDQATDDGVYGLVLSVGRLTFDAQLLGREGQRALRDFVVVVQSRHLAPASV